MFYDVDECNIASCADDNTTYTSDFNLGEEIQKLELTNNDLFKWFIKIGEFDVKNTLQIPDSYYEKMKTQNKHISVHFEYFFHLSL